MGYGLIISVGTVRKCGPVKWFDEKGGYSFYKINDELNVDAESQMKTFNDEAMYWVDESNELVHKDPYGYYRKLISLKKVIKELKTILNETHPNEELRMRDNKEVKECIDILENNYKKGYRKALLIGQ